MSRRRLVARASGGATPVRGWGPPHARRHTQQEDIDVAGPWRKDATKTPHPPFDTGGCGEDSTGSALVSSLAKSPPEPVRSAATLVRSVNSTSDLGPQERFFMSRTIPTLYAQHIAAVALCQQPNGVRVPATFHVVSQRKLARGCRAPRAPQVAGIAQREDQPLKTCALPRPAHDATLSGPETGTAGPGRDTPHHGGVVHANDDAAGPGGDPSRHPREASR